MTIRERRKLRLQWDSVSPRPEWQSLRMQMTGDAREDVDRSELFQLGQIDCEATVETSVKFSR